MEYCDTKINRVTLILISLKEFVDKSNSENYIRRFFQNDIPICHCIFHNQYSKQQ